MIEVNRRETLAISATLGALAMAGAAGAAGASTGAQWDLTDLYPSDAAWAADREALMKRLPALTALRGKLGDSAAAMKAAFVEISAVNRQVERLHVYASLKADEDLRIAANQERRQLADDLYNGFNQSISWINPEVLAIGKAKVEGFLAAEPGLAPFKFQIQEVLRLAPYTLTADGEKLLAAAGAPLQGPNDIRNQLTSSDMPRPEVTLSDGRKVRLDDQGYTLNRTAPNRADRKLVFDQFWGSYKTFESSLGAALLSNIKGEIFAARARNYPSALTAALGGQNLPETVYRTLVAEANRGLPVLHRYFELRRRMLKLPDIGYHDIYPSLVSLDRRFSLDDMRRLTLESTAPLGKDYAATFARASAARWMDPYPRPGKASGAYMAGSAYDVHPYLLLNLGDDYEGLTTYAHEWGHAMHSLLANKAQPYELSDYPIFTAEIASTCQEQLLAKYMLGRAKTKEEKLFYLGQMMESYRGTFFRQTMFAEFQLAIHDLADKGEGLSGEKFTALYMDLLRKYHGPKMMFEPVYGVEWSFIPHFFYGFYVFQYATSITSAVFFADKLQRGGAAERENYLSVLRAGGSDHGYAILKKAGLDMATPEPYQVLIADFAKVLDQAEALL